MTKGLLLAFALFSAAALRAETVDLGSYGRLTFTVDPAAWTVTSARAPGNTYEVHIKSKTNVNAECGFNVILDPAEDSSTKAKLRTVFLEETSGFAKASMERASNPTELNGKTGYGWAANFTDPSGVGQPFKKGEAKVQTVVMLIVSPKVGISGSIYSDGFKETAHSQLLAMFQTMEVLPTIPAIPAKK